MHTASLPLSRSRFGRRPSTRHPRRAPGVALAAFLSLLALLVSACGGSGSNTTSADALPDNQQVLQNVITGVQDIATLDPAIVQEVPSSTVLNLLWPALLTENEKLQPVPWAADAMPTTSADGLTYTFHLRSGMKFSDGEPIDAAAFAYSINRSADPCTASPVAYYTVRDQRRPDLQRRALQ